jgi:hypothetical protein
MSNTTYTTTITKPRLVISYDPFATSPREDSNLGEAITISNNYRSIDENNELKAIIQENKASTLASHLANIKEACKAFDADIVDVLPIAKYEHSNVRYYLTDTVPGGFDSCVTGFYFVRQSRLDDAGVKLANAKEAISQELENYTMWANGEVYMVQIFDEDGELEDCYSGFYSLEEAKVSVPSEFQDNNQIQEYLDELNSFYKNAKEIYEDDEYREYLDIIQINIRDFKLTMDRLVPLVQDGDILKQTNALLVELNTIAYSYV